MVVPIVKSVSISYCLVSNFCQLVFSTVKNCVRVAWVPNDCQFVLPIPSVQCQVALFSANLASTDGPRIWITEENHEVFAYLWSNGTTTLNYTLHCSHSRNISHFSILLAVFVQCWRKKTESKDMCRFRLTDFLGKDGSNCLHILRCPVSFAGEGW